MKRLLIKMHNSRRKGFTLIELLVVITIIGILMALVVVTIQPIQRRSRDSKRKADVNLFISGLTLFQADFKLYPNYTFYLGKNGANSSDTGAKNSYLDLGSDISKCPNSGAGAPSKFATTTADSTYNTAFLKPGFISVNNFLVCLKYLDREIVDPKPDTTNVQLNYQYRINYDYTQYLVSSQAENQNDPSLVDKLFADGATMSPKRYFEGNGRNVRQLDDDTDAAPSDGFFYLGGSVSSPLTNGRYFYQVAWTFETGDYAEISRDSRPLSKYDPIIYSNGSWIANPIPQSNKGEKEHG